MPKLLIISHNEICYNARLLKAADFFHDEGWSVTVFNGVTGIAPEGVYLDTKKSRGWKVIENDISKRSFKSKIRWWANGLLFKMVKFSVDTLKLQVWSKYYLNKSLILAPNLSNEKYDYILFHLVDTLPFAVELKHKLGAKLIYDNQEYFVGQYTAFEKSKYDWVKKVQDRFIYDADVVIATTTAMANKLKSDYEINSPIYRVRNVPTRGQVAKKVEEVIVEASRKDALKLVWHGMGVYFNNRRGVHILIKAIAHCKENVQLFLQGNLTEQQKEVYSQYDQEFMLGNKVVFVPAAHPDQIVQSLKAYDIGLTPELPEELNQELTSSNKLFDYIHAGLAVLSSDALGLAETIDEYNLGLKFEPGDYLALSKHIDRLAVNREELNQLKANSIKAREELYWGDDYKKVLEVL